jgi:nucleotide-binding universal stress UspA family protein
VKVLVATDGSELAVRAAQRAFELLGTPTEVTVLAVLTHVPGDDAGGFEGPTESPAEEDLEWKTETTDAKEAIERTAQAIPVALVERRLETGDAGPMIVWVAEHIGADVIVVGSHGHRGRLKRMVLGSVSEHVMHHAPCAVLVVREPDQ